MGEQKINANVPAEVVHSVAEEASETVEPSVLKKTSTALLPENATVTACGLVIVEENGDVDAEEWQDY